YKILPDVRIAWRDVWVGASFTAFLFNVGKYLIGLYLGRTSIGSIYGAAGSLVIILVWIYYSTSIFLFGAEFTQVFSKRWGSRVPPRAVRADPGVATAPPVSPASKTSAAAASSAASPSETGAGALRSRSDSRS